MRKIVYISVSITIIFALVGFKTITKIDAWEVSSKEELISVYQKSMEWFSKNTNYKVDVKYSSFSDHTIATPYDKSEGFYIRSNNNFHSMVLGVKTIQNERMRLVIDASSQIIIINNSAKNAQTPFDSRGFSELAEQLKAIKKQKNNIGEIIYRMEFKPNGLYKAYEFKINESGLLTGVRYYYAKEMKEDEEDENSLKGTPRVEIDYSSYQTNVSLNYEKEFSEKKYFKEEGKKITLNSEYKTFELKDYRFTEKK